MRESDGTSGIYTTTSTENGVPVYYYRGAVDNNHVLFAGFCWEIVRTTETGGVKLIYDGLPSDGTCANTGEASQLYSTSVFNSSYNSPAYVGYMYGPVYTNSSKPVSSLSGNIVYGNDVTYDTETGEYTLVDTITKDIANWSSDKSTIGSRYHYTCFSTASSCTTVNYMHYTGSTSTIYYFALTGGKTQLDLLDEMLNGNVTNSTAKRAVDNWYATNMTSYTSKLEDTVYCNDRSIYSYAGWDKDTNNSTGSWYLQFGGSGRLESAKNPTLICSRELDKFTTNADSTLGNGKLTYPVGLISADEIAYAGAVLEYENTSFYLNTGQSMWSVSPYLFYIDYAYGFDLSSTGRFSNDSVYLANGLRPAVSLKPGTVVSSGDGSSDSPYVI